MSRTDDYLSHKARSVWPAARVWEAWDGSWWMERRPADTPVLLSENISTDKSPRASFHAARRALYALRDAQKENRQ